MEELFIDFNKRDFMRRTSAVTAAFFGVTGITQLLGPANRIPILIPVAEIVASLGLAVHWLSPPKWYFRVDRSGIEYKRQLMSPRRFDWSAITRLDLPPDKITIVLADGRSANIGFSFLMQKERLAIRGAVTKFASERNLLSTT